MRGGSAGSQHKPYSPWSRLLYFFCDSGQARNIRPPPCQEVERHGHVVRLPIREGRTCNKIAEVTMTSLSPCARDHPNSESSLSLCWSRPRSELQRNAVTDRDCSRQRRDHLQSEIQIFTGVGFLYQEIRSMLSAPLVLESHSICPIIV